MDRTSTPSSVVPVLLVTIVTLGAAYISRQACSGFGPGASFYCYSDYGPIYLDRALTTGTPLGMPGLEYPIGLGAILWLAAAAGGSVQGFAYVSMALSAVAALAIVWLLWQQTGQRALFFAAAPTLVLYAFLNWDLLALVWAIAAVVAFAHRKDVAAGICLGLGTAIKMFPLFVLIPMVIQQLRAGENRQAAWLAIGAAVPVLAINAPAAWVSFDNWTYFFRFNAARVVDWGSLWSAGCTTFGTSLCGNIPLVNVLSLLLFAICAIAALRLITRVAPDIPRWELAFPLLVVFFLTSKVFSPQYSLWILPWFALVLPNLGWFLAYEALDIAVYIATFGWQQHLTGVGGLPMWPLNLVLLIRALLLVAILAAFARRAAAESATRRHTESRSA